MGKFVPFGIAIFALFASSGVSGQWLFGTADETNEIVDSAARECSRYEFTCYDKSCISEDKVCDGFDDCEVGEDEFNCPTCLDGFTCDGSRCIDSNQVCDGNDDCIDGTDESAEICGCKRDEFKCVSGECISKDLRCDKRFDCKDGSDEEECQADQCSRYQFQCYDNECIDLSKRCDGRIDCRQAEDEENCPPGPTQCSYGERACDDGLCLPEALFCDRKYDCRDSSDEKNCTAPITDNCGRGEFQCGDQSCIPEGYRCDGKYDCLDRLDEADCPGTCRRGEFTCGDGSCIPESFRCDRQYQCTDGSDERDCSICEVNEFYCQSERYCIDGSKRCNSIPDCRDGSDEFDCPGCRSDEFTCNNGMCIPQSQRCNGYQECSDYSDETNCPPKGCRSDEFRCESGQCVPQSAKCNGYNDCYDLSDEYNCPPPKPTCSSYEFACPDRCIDERYVCDGVNQCSDGSDERNCPPRGCESYEFTCSNGQCIDNRFVCDGVSQCYDGTDERNCPPRPPACQDYEFTCANGQCIDGRLRCNSYPDCADGSDESSCPVVPTPDSSSELNLQTYPGYQEIEEGREVVFQCRDIGDIRAPVRWVRDGGLPLPPGYSDQRGRLTIPNIQLQHSGAYYCEATNVPLSTPGRRVSVQLDVIPFIKPPIPSGPPECNVAEATCRNGECIPKSAICDGDFDCSDASDETRCSLDGCEPNEFQCDNKQCVLKSWICDSDDDCGDGSDEANCAAQVEGELCRSNEFTCVEAKQCIPKSFHCDKESDCFGGADEFGCDKPQVSELPPRSLMVNAGETFEITCRVLGTPTPIVVWRLNWGHVPAKCSMTSVDGYGVLRCPNALPNDQGAYSCEAINSLGSVFASTDCIVTVKGGNATVCPPPKFNAAATSPSQCLDCFCFGATDQCYSSEKFVSQHSPGTDQFTLVGVNQNQNQGNFEIQDQRYPIRTDFLRRDDFSATLSIQDRSVIGGPGDLIVYYSLPESHKRDQLNSYGGYLRYSIEFTDGGGSGPVRPAPDVIIKGNGIVLMHIHEGNILPNQQNRLDVRIWPGQWYKRVVGRGNRLQAEELATREDIMMVLADIDHFLIRALYTDNVFVQSTISNVQLDTAVFSNNNQDRAVFVEECNCPQGYVGNSCKDCAPNYRRVRDGPYLGRCVRDIPCPPGEYGDPAANIPCLPCPCPLTNPSNQFTSSCYLDTDGQVTCNCPAGYRGRRCESCADGYQGNPNIRGESCQPDGECSAAGSTSIYRDPNTNLCPCKEFVLGPKCDQCRENSFFLHRDNQYGCINCFCMGITNKCKSSTWYRTQEVVAFRSNVQGFELIDQNQRTVISNNEIFVDAGNQNLMFREFSRFGQGVFYWKLPAQFLGNKVTSYGGNLTYTLSYTPAPGGLSSRNNAYDVELHGFDIVLRYFYKQQLPAVQYNTLSVPFYEQYWQRQDGQTADREHFLMALADLKYILIKATYTTNTQEVGLKRVSLDYAIERNTGQGRAHAVEMCDCPTGYVGLSCEKCDVGFTRDSSGIHLGTCERCQCNGHSEECDPEDGVCYNCRDNTQGEFCQDCAPGYYKDRSNRCVRAPDSCSCDPRGSVSAQCINNKCQCKENVDGDQCNTCKSGHFHLSEENPQGCLSCWCNGITDRCFSSTFNWNQIPMQLIGDHGYTITNRDRTTVISDNLVVNFGESDISYNRFNRQRPVEIFFWSLPSMFTGNILKSYGGNLTITQYYESEPGSFQYNDADVIFKSSSGKEFIWMRNSQMVSGRPYTYSVHMIESSFTVDQRPASRSKFLEAMANIEAILIRATISERTKSSHLRDVTMDTAMQGQTGQPRASEVEQCACPSEYKGLSCESCKDGYYKSKRDGRCLQCPCHNQEESCYEEEFSGRVVCNCLPGYTGEYCNVADTDGSRNTTRDVEIMITPPYMTVTAGTDITFSCLALQRQGISMLTTWSRVDNQPLPYGRAIDNSRGQLTISPVKVSDAGVYQCVVTDGFGHIYTEDARLNVEPGGRGEPSRPTVVIEERKVFYRITTGESIEIRCLAQQGQPAPTLAWVREDNRPLSQNVIQRNGLLQFNNAQPSDSGRYICLASNYIGTDEITVTVNIEGATGPQPGRPPVYNNVPVQIPQGDLQVNPGEYVRLECTVPTYINLRSRLWSKRNDRLPTKASQAEGVLTIPDADFTDSGFYICKVVDSTGKSGEVSVRVDIIQSMNLPTVRILPERQIINQGTDAELHCNATGNPTPEVKWSKMHSEVGPNVRIEGNYLRIRNAAVSDRGMYICSASNQVGTSTAASILEVERRDIPVVEIYPAERQVIEKGAGALFQCVVTAGIPSPVIIWTRADGKRLSTSTEVLNGGVIRFNRVSAEDEGRYVCTATNEVGKASVIASLEIKSLPIISVRPNQSPIRVQKGEKLHLECSANGDPAPSVSWKKLEVGLPTRLDSVSTRASSSVYEITSVRQSDEGTYQCTATNEVGISEERVQVHVIENLPGSIPRPISRPFNTTQVGSDENYVGVGGTFRFSCTVSGSPRRDFDIQFIRSDGQPLPRNHEERNGILLVSNVRYDAAGQYACLVTDRQTKQIITTTYSTLRVIEPPRVRVEPREQLVRPGDVVRVTCYADGHQPIQISWQREDGPMPPSVIIRNGELLFNGIQTEDQGKYVCTAKNDFDMISTGLSMVKVNEQPLLASLQQDVTAYEGQDTELRCESSGIDPQLITWTKNGARLPQNASPTSNILRINQVQVDNSGTYKCEVILPNSQVISDSIKLTVERDYAVQVRIEMEPQSPFVGDRVILTCGIQEAQVADYRWFKVVGGKVSQTLGTTKTLILEDVQPQDGGIYTCQVATPIGVFVKETAVPILSSPSIFGRSVDTKSAQYGSLVVMNCKIQLNEPITYTWSKQNGRLPLSASQNGAYLEIPKVHTEDAGTYICTADNYVQTVEQATLLLVTGVIPRFNYRSFIALPTVKQAYHSFDMEISFRPESPNGLILYSSQEPLYKGDFVSLGLKDGFVEFRFDLGSGPAVLLSENRVDMNQWHTVKIARTKKDGVMIVNDERPVNGESVGRNHGMDLTSPLYLGGIPDMSSINPGAGFTEGFAGCISRLVIGNMVSEILTEATEQVDVTPCETCRDDVCMNNGVCQESFVKKGYKCICSPGFTGERCEATGESCYPGICGDGRCENKKGGYDCFCPFGKSGKNCEQEIQITEPYFSNQAYMTIPSSSSISRFSIRLRIKPESVEDGIIMYGGEKAHGGGDFTSLTIKDKKIEFKYNLGDATATLQSIEDIVPGEWIEIYANRTNRDGALKIGDYDVVRGVSPGRHRGLNVKTPIYIGGTDKRMVRVPSDVGVEIGFNGCLADIEILDSRINLREFNSDSANVKQCGSSGVSSSPCNPNPCSSESECVEDSRQHKGYYCHCTGSNCEDSVCDQRRPCMHGSTCVDEGPNGFTCLCPFGYSGQNCEHEIEIFDSASFRGNSWIEVPKSMFSSRGKINKVEIVLSTLENDGLIFWYGNDPKTPQEGSYLSIAMEKGFVVYSYDLGSGPAIIKSKVALNDGERHKIVIFRNGLRGSMTIDGGQRIVGQGLGRNVELNVQGSIYIGGLPDYNGVTEDRFSSGFSGCIHSLVIGQKTISKFSDIAISGVNVAICPSSMHVTDTLEEHQFSDGLSYKRRTVVRAEKTVQTTRKIYPGGKK